METLPMFPIAEQEPDASPTDHEESNDFANVNGTQDTTDDVGIVDGEESDRADILTHNQQEFSGPDNEAPDTQDHVEVQETPSIYESTGLMGPFELSPIALIFPESAEDIIPLAANIEFNGLLEEITVARTRGPGNSPEVVDGRRRLKGCEIAGVQPRYRLLRKDIDPRAYVWAKNGERRDLDKSQKAFAAADLSRFPGPGRPRKVDENSAVLQNFPKLTMDEVASGRRFSTRLLSDAAKIAAEDGPAVPELREAVRQGVATVTDAAKDKVIGAPPEVQRRAVALVKEGHAKTVATAVARVLADSPEMEQDQETALESPMKCGDRATFYRCSVADLGKRLQPGMVDFVLAHPPEDARLAVFSDLGALGTKVLAEEGVMIVAVSDTGRLPEVLSRLRKDGPGWIMEFSLFFPYPVATSGEPHWIDFRRVALLVCGKSGARLSGEDVIEVPAHGPLAEGRPLQLGDAMVLLVRRFVSERQVVCLPILQGNWSAVLEALEVGCTLIGADDDEVSLGRIVAELELSGDP